MSLSAVEMVIDDMLHNVGVSRTNKNEQPFSFLMFWFFLFFFFHPVGLGCVVTALPGVNRRKNIITNMMDTTSSSTTSTTPPNNNNSRQVILEGGLPWGFRIQGGSDTGVQLRIARVSIPTAVIHHCADAHSSYWVDSLLGCWMLFVFLDIQAAHHNINHKQKNSVVLCIYSSALYNRAVSFSSWLYQRL